MSNSKAQTLINHLQQEIKYIQQLTAILADERKALSTRQFDLLEGYAKQKNELSAQLEASSKERIELAAYQTPSENNAEFKKFLSTCSPEEIKQINLLNNTLKNELEECRTSNTINGQVIATNVYTSQQIVNILSGKNEKESQVYTAKGNIQSSQGPEGIHHQEA